jgi:hypothetical protein
MLGMPGMRRASRGEIIGTLAPRGLQARGAKDAWKYRFYSLWPPWLRA